MELTTELIKSLGPVGATIVISVYLWVNGRKGDAENKVALTTFSTHQEQRLEELTRQMAEIAVKVNTIWDTYVLDALKMSQHSGMTRHGSPLHPTELWGQALPEDLRKDLESYISQVAQVENIGADDAALQTWVRFRKPLTGLLSERDDLTASAVLGTLVTIAQNCKEQKL